MVKGYHNGDKKSQVIRKAFMPVRLQLELLKAKIRSTAAIFTQANFNPAFTKTGVRTETEIEISLLLEIVHCAKIATCGRVILLDLELSDDSTIYL